MPRFRTIVPSALLSAVVLALVSACGAGSPGDQSSVAATNGIGGGTSATGTGADAGSSSSTDSDSPPPTEDTGGTEAAGPAQGSKPSLDVAGLPIGVNADGNCLFVRLLSSASEVPPGMGLRITGVSFTPQAIAASGANCSGNDQPCLGLTLTETSTDECVVPVEATGEAAPDGRVAVGLQASVVCPPGQTSACEAYAQKLQDDFRNQDPVTVSVPESSSDSSSSGSSSDSSSAGSSSDSSSDSSSSDSSS